MRERGSRREMGKEAEKRSLGWKRKGERKGKEERGKIRERKEGKWRGKERSRKTKDGDGRHIKGRRRKDEG